jgi:long-chain acyl-CoA synthetase
MNIADMLGEVRAQFKTKPIVLFGDRCVGMQDFESQVAAWRRKLRGDGISKGDMVVLLARNKPEWLACCFAGLSVGAVMVPVNPALTANEVRHIIDHSEPKLVVADADLSPLCSLAAHKPGLSVLGHLPMDHAAADEVPVDCSSDDPAFIFYTSGTTGNPKGAVITHGSVLHTTALEAGHFDITPGDVTLVVGSLAFIYPLVLNALSCLRGGASIGLTDKFHPASAIASVEQWKVTILMGVPTMYVMLANYAQGKVAGLPSLRLCISGGAVLAPSLVDRFAREFGIQLFDLWGLTEGTPLTSYKPGVDAAVRPESCGRALPGVSLRVVDDGGDTLATGQVGEVLARTPSVMLGYYRNPRATLDTIGDGWLRTGDLGKLDEDGYLCILGRKKDLIIRAGANIYPSEIEEIVFKIPQVAECCVVGLPHDVYGEEVAAFIVPRGAEQLTADEVRRQCREHVGEYKVPTIIEFVDSLPKGPTGKILKRALREQWSRKMESV